MWVLELLWTGLGLAAVVGTEREGLEGAAFTIVMLLILLVPVCLIIQSSHPSQTGQRRANQRLEAEGSVYRCTHVRCVRLRPGQRFCVVPAKLGHPIGRSLRKKSAAWQCFLLGKATPPGFVAFGWGLTWLSRRVLSIRRLLLRDGSVKQRWWNACSRATLVSPSVLSP